MGQRATRLAVIAAVLAAAPLAAVVGSASTHPAKAAAASSVGAGDAPEARSALRGLAAVRVARRTERVNVVERRAIARRLAIKVVHKAAAQQVASRPAAPATTQVVSQPAAPATTQQVASQPAESAATRRLASELHFRWPIEGRITTPFIPSGPLRHDGIDIAELSSLTVSAAASGQVIHVGYTTGFEGYGEIVDVVVAPGVETIYAHLSAEAVQVGENVQEGQVLGTAGCTGRCTGTHLHFEVRENGTPVDPLDFLH